MPRLKKLKFNDVGELLEYFNENEEDVHKRTLKSMKSYYIKNKCVGNIDIFNIDLLEDPHFKKLTIFKDEWELCFHKMDEFYISKEDYESAKMVLDFKNLVLNK